MDPTLGVRNTDTRITCLVCDSRLHLRFGNSSDWKNSIRKGIETGIKSPDNGNNSKAKRKEKWGKLTDDEIDVVEGKRDQLVGKIQQRYGIAKDQAEKEVDAWAKGF